MLFPNDTEVSAGPAETSWNPDECENYGFGAPGDPGTVAVVFEPGWTETGVHEFVDEFVLVPAEDPKPGFDLRPELGSLQNSDGVLALALCRPLPPEGVIEQMVAEFRSSPDVAEVHVDASGQALRQLRASNGELRGPDR
ncbi:MAG: hypothetical protein GY812_10150 [Actinomycetia bacterium]|nr:hypothetical protein [Actinomycetes bacterium]